MTLVMCSGAADLRPNPLLKYKIKNLTFSDKCPDLLRYQNSVRS